MTHIVIFNIALLAACGYALLAGGAPERAAAFVFLCASLATYIAPFNHYHTVSEGVLAVDVFTLVAMTAIALVANRFWPLYESALLLLTVAVHGVKAYQPALVYWMYHGAVGKIAYPTLILLVVGVYRHRQRISQAGQEGAWSFSVLGQR